MKKIRMLSTVTGGINFSAGWEGEVDDAIAADLINCGHAESFDTKPKPPAADTIKVKITETIAGSEYSYARGFEGYIPENIAKELIRAGHAVALDSKPSDLTEKATSKQAANAEKR